MEEALVAGVYARNPRDVARALSVVIDEAPGAAALLRRIEPRTGRAHRIGITGAPGVGKSTLVDALLAAYRRAGLTVGVLAVDPSSAFSGGALLGDRVRMQAHASDPGVFVRSLATRGHLGGLATTTEHAAAILDAAGFDLILIETVGVGQDEIEIAHVADTTVVVLSPVGGDDVQALKAGLMEIGDVFVINKADQPGASRTSAVVQSALALSPVRRDGWIPPLVRTVATSAAGIDELISALNRHAAPGVARREQRRKNREARASAGSDAAAPRVDHIAVAVHDAADVRRFFEDVLGLAASEAEEVRSQSVRVRFLGAGPPTLEIVEPLDTASPLTGFLERRGPGLHHVAFEVVGLEAWLARLEAAGVRLIDRTPRPGASGASVAFVHPSGTGGVLVELIEREADRAGR